MDINENLTRLEKVNAKLCGGGHVCSAPKVCCTLGCCYTYPQIVTPISEALTIALWTYWYLWAVVLAGLAISAACGCWLWKRRQVSNLDDYTPSDMASTGSCYLPPHYSRCNSFVQTLPPPYNEVTSKPDLYPLVIGYDDGIGKRASGFVMRYFRSLSHASTLDSLSSSFMCNVVNEANTIIPPPYSCNNSIDELSAMGCERGENVDCSASVMSLTNNRTASDVSSLNAQSPSSPPRATSPTIELRELLDKIQQLPQIPTGQSSGAAATNQNRPQVLCPGSSAHRSQGYDDAAWSKSRRVRGKMYMPVGPPSTRKAKRWLSRSAPTTPSGTIPSGNIAMSFLPGQSRRPSDGGNGNQQVVPLLSEQDETEHANNVDTH